MFLEKKSEHKTVRTIHVHLEIGFFNVHSFKGHYFRTIFRKHKVVKQHQTKRRVERGC